MGCRCFWDPDTDAYAEDTYRNVRPLDPIPAPLASLAPHRPNIRPGGARAPSHRLPDVNCPALVPDSPKLSAAVRTWQDSLFCVAAAFGSYLY